MSFPNIPRVSADTLKLVLFASLAALAVWFFVIRPDAAQQAAADARGSEAVAEAQAGATKDTVEIIVKHRNEIDTITTRTEVTNREIRNAPGAETEIDPELHRSGVDALCMHDGRENDPACQ